MITNSINGYIYIRNHPSYNEYDACKMGKTTNIPERDIQYATGEIKRGYFELVIQVPVLKLNILEKVLQNEFCYLNVKHDAGIEFYNKKIIPLIEPYLTNIKLQFKTLSKQEIDDLVRCNRVRETLNKINIQSLIQILKSNKQNISYKPKDYQRVIIQKSYEYFQTKDKGLLIMPCGMGKTLVSLWITQELNSNTILIGVPNILLLKQWRNVINIIFSDISYLVVSSGVDIKTITKFLENNQIKCIVITTYSSAYKVFSATQNICYTFDMKINDECHHLTSSSMEIAHNTKQYIQMLNIKSIKQISLTATLKQIENIDPRKRIALDYASSRRAGEPLGENDNNNVISNDNIEYFGEIIDRKCLLWAINENIICDYVIQTIITNEEQIAVDNENDKRLFLSAFASLKSINDGNSHHLLIYSNNKDNSHKLIEYIKQILDDSYFHIPDLYYSSYHGDMTSKEQNKILNNFNKAKFGIISCVYCLGEGYDNHTIDAVVFAENMSSNIRIVQSALRAGRKNNLEPSKITKIILPIVNNDWLENNENSDLKKVKEVVYQMGLEDETIAQKMQVLKINIIKEANNKEQNNKEFGKYDEELTKQLRLKTIRRSIFGITYEKAKKIIASKNIKNISKEEYNKLCDIDNRLSTEPEIIYKGQFTNWIEYLGIERVYYDLETCKNKINQYLSQYPEIKTLLEISSINNELCKLDPLFPPCDLWVEYYKVKDLRDVIIIKKKKTGMFIK
jgi:superfamily II DNA or RNA helicase